MLFVIACLFKIPHIIWKIFEGGMMKKFREDEKTVEKFDELVQGHFVRFNKMGRRKKIFLYYGVFVLCEVLNVVVLALNWWFIQLFLHDKFHSYGAKVMEYYSEERSVRKNCS